MSEHLASALADGGISRVINDLSTTEVWLPVKVAPSYEVSSFGNVRRGGKLLSFAQVHGYCLVTLSVSGKTKNWRVHRLVALTFLGDPLFPGAIVAHNDGNKNNNRLSNLRWASFSENEFDRVRHRTRTRGSSVHCAVLSEGDIPVIRHRIHAGERYNDIASDYGVSISTISLIKRKKIWQHVNGAAWGNQNAR